MEITNIRIKPVDEPRLKGIATVVFDHDFAVNDIKIIDGNRRLCLEFPKDKANKNPHYVSCAPLNHEMRDYIESMVFKCYHIGGDYCLREDAPDDTGKQSYDKSNRFSA